MALIAAAHRLQLARMSQAQREAEVLVLGASSWWPLPLQVVVRDFPTRWRFARAQHAGHINRLLFPCALCYINHTHLETDAYLYYRLRKNRFVIKCRSRVLPLLFRHNYTTFSLL